MKSRIRTKLGQPLAAFATGAAVLGLTTWMGVVPAMAATTQTATTTTSASTDFSNSPYAVLGKVTSQPVALTMNPDNTLVQNKVNWSASGLPANTKLNLVWETYTGEWQTQKEHFIGAHYTPGKTTLMQVTTDANGNASGSFTAPEGFGDAHMVGLVNDQGDVVAAGTIMLSPVATISSTAEPEGKFFHIHVDGVGIGSYTSVYQVLYDNHLMGNVSAVTTDGQADFTVRAEGGVGTHTIQLIVGGVEGPYLNAAQSPFNYRPNYSFVVHVTPGDPKTVSDTLPTPTPSIGSHLTASVGSGIVGSKFTLSGSSLTPNHPYQLVWNTMAGSRVSGKGYQTKQISLGSVITDANGNFSKSLTVPDDLGGPAHSIQLLDGTQVDGETTFRIYPSLVSAPKKVTVGQHFTVSLQGVGWTEYDNTYAIDYDNGTIGYVCGFNSHGDVNIQLQASGKPGYHYIDIYPSVYKGKQTLPNLYGLPLLTYAKDHPGDNLPAFHVVVDVVPASNQTVLSINGSDALNMPALGSGNQTEVPLWYVMSGLKKLGIHSTWNGHALAITDSNVHVPAVKGVFGNTTFTVNGKTVLTGTSEVDTVPGTSNKTTYVGLSTMNDVLAKLGIQTTHTASTWSWTTK